MNPNDRQKQAQTLPQFLTALSEYLPGGYVFAYRVHLESLWRDGCTVREAYDYAAALLSAPYVGPGSAWNGIRPPTTDEAEALAPSVSPTSAPTNHPANPQMPDERTAQGWRKLLGDLYPGEDSAGL